MICGHEMPGALALRAMVAVVLLMIGVGAWGAEDGFFRGPGMQGFVKIEVYEADGDGDGDRETTVRRFRNIAGDSMFTMTTGEKLWAWSLESVQDEGIEHNYVLFDSDCDGRFDRRYGLDEEFTPPDCLN